MRKQSVGRDELQASQSKSTAGYTTKLGDIANEFGVSAIEVGKLLRAAGMRTEKGYPTAKAVDRGLARSTWDGQDRKNEWHIQNVLIALKAAER
jgi:hypothetical protein